MRGIEEEFEAVDPPQSMQNFSLLEVALAYKQKAIYEKLMQSCPVLNRIYAQPSSEFVPINIENVESLLE